MIGAWTFIIVVSALWVLAAILAAWRIYRLSRGPSDHRIAEHDEEYWNE